ncbi:hypothetical protein BGZ98_001035 [Dissophora globulifera]|nr:hypothetical protein BGZ98_001035 [Dissophora globulifera]
MIFSTRAYSCPYRNVEKGIMLLYVLVKGVSLSDMAQYIPKTSFHTIHKEFYMHNPDALNRLLTTMLSKMFSTLKSHYLASQRNPDPFKNVTLNLDGHDSRVMHVNADKASMYSYKLKKSGFRVQVCTDMNNMINKLDCIALDGGYNLYINKLLDSSDELQYENFYYPICKTHGIALTDEEKSYNDIFGSFRSKIEGHFGEMHSTFAKFSHMVVNKVAEKDTFGLQYKLACLQLNIKRFAALNNIPTEQHHMFWVQDGFDYPSKTENLETMYTLPNIKVKLSQSEALLAMWKAFLDMAISSQTQSANADMISGDDDRDYEVEKIIGH